MRILDSIKLLFRRPYSIEQLEKFPSMTDRWIYFDYVIPITDSTLSHLSELSFKETPSRGKIVMGFMFPYLGLESENSIPGKKLVFGESRIGTQDPMFAFLGDTPCVLIKFRDLAKEDYDLTVPKIGPISSGAQNEYLLSPIELIKYRKILHGIEGTLIRSPFGLRQHPWGKQRNLIQLDYDEEGELRIRRTNGVAHFGYTLKKRIELYVECPECDKLVFEMGLPDKVKWIHSKREESDYMREYCSRTIAILNQYNVNLEGRK